MTKEQATAEATKVANDDNIVMVVTFNPYDEEPAQYGYFPEGATKIFKFDEVIETIYPGDTK